MVYTIIVHLKVKDLESSALLSAKLQDAAAIYRKDQETLSWFVNYDPLDPLSFSIVERFVNEASQKYHLENPFWATFGPFVGPLLSQPMNLTRWTELEVSVPNQDSIGYTA